jgi:hypothetical protein
MKRLTKEKTKKKITSKKASLFVTLFLCMLTLIGSSVWFMGKPVSVSGDTEMVQTVISPLVPEGKYVVIRLDAMTVTLRTGTTTLSILPILTIGKPGSYYETIGGSYINDYKEPLHFSSIGHVFMPYSVHVFGNYFIHGIPYYQSGEQVSSAYSGGCVRLSNENAKIVYDFISNGTPIIITKDNEFGFEKIAISTSTIESKEMTNLMVASISLETLPQDTTITDTDGITKTTRRSTLPRLIKGGDVSISALYASGLSTSEFITRMNSKAEALGLTNTHFINVYDPVVTTEHDKERFMGYIQTYKSYLLTLSE